MIYVMGNIRGDKAKYDEMMGKISLDFEDAVFVLGDIIGKGDDSIAILQDMMCNSGVYPVLGQQEYYAKRIFPLIKDCHNLDEAKAALEGENAELFDEWLAMGIEKAVMDFLSLDDEDKEGIIDFLDEFQTYEKLDVNGKTFVLVHAGIKGYEEGKDLEDYDAAAFVSEAPDYTKALLPKGNILVTGHTPTVAISKACFGKIFAKSGHVAIDCGCGYPDGRLACVCLDKMKVYYC